MRRGEVWVGNLNPNRGTEVGKIRPVLILQADFLIERNLPTVVVLPLTTAVRANLEPLRITIVARDNLRHRCQVMPDQPRTLDRERIGNGPLTILTDEEMGRVEQALLAVMGFI